MSDYNDTYTDEVFASIEASLETLADNKLFLQNKSNELIRLYKDKDDYNSMLDKIVGKNPTMRIKTKNSKTFVLNNDDNHYNLFYDFIVTSLQQYVALRENEINDIEV